MELIFVHPSFKEKTLYTFNQYTQGHRFYILLLKCIHKVMEHLCYKIVHIGHKNIGS
jgi:adenine-specific DNA methylase